MHTHTADRTVIRFERCDACRSDCIDACFGEKARSVAIPTVAQMRAQVGPRERAMSADNDAYRRLRRSGIQPRNVDGSAELEAKLNHLPPKDPRANNARVVDLATVRANEAK